MAVIFILIQHEILNRCCILFSGKRSKDSSHPDYVPSVFIHSKVKKVSQEKKLKRFERITKRREQQTAKSSATSETSEVSVREEEQNEFEKAKVELGK